MLYIITANSSWWDYVLRELKDRKDISFIYVTYRTNFFLKILRKICSMFFIRPSFLYFTISAKQLKKVLPNDRVLLLNVSNKFLDIEGKIARKIPVETKKYIWLSNSCQKIYGAAENITEMLEKRQSLGYRICTFDTCDAKNYNLVYLNQVCGKTTHRNPTAQPEYDFYFLGLSKGREKLLEELNLFLKGNSFNVNFIIIRNPKDVIEYEDNIRNILNSKCIVDIVQEGQNGLTFRPLEAIFTQKKLLTNYQNVINYDFYNPNNIFIIGKDDWDDLKNFINSPYEKIPEKIIAKYDVKNWINNFIN